MATPLLAMLLGGDGLIVLGVVVVVLLFGGSRLPHLARGLGSAKAEFERGLTSAQHAPGDKVGDHTETHSAHR